MGSVKIPPPRVVLPSEAPLAQEKLTPQPPLEAPPPEMYSKPESSSVELLPSRYAIENVNERGRASKSLPAMMAIKGMAIRAVKEHMRSGESSTTSSRRAIDEDAPWRPRKAQRCIS